MEDDIKILEVEYLSNQLSDLPQILNFRLGDQININDCLKWRRPPMEEDLEICNMEYINNHWSDLSKILNLSLGDQTEIKQ